jgi:hypothetical protein
MTFAQNDAMATLMTNSYNSLQAAGVISTPAAQSISAVVGQVYTGSNPSLINATATITNTVNNQIASLVTNGSQFGTQLTAQWATGLPSVTSLTSNLTSITGQLGAAGIPGLSTLTSGITPTLASAQTAMNVLGKASEFAATATSTITGSLSSLTSSLPSLDSLSGLISLDSLSSLGSLGSLPGLDSIPGLSALGGLFGGGGGLISSVQQAAGFTNTVSRAPVDVAMTKIFGSSKIPAPNYGGISSAGVALDISQAQSILSNQGSSLLSQTQSSVGSVPVFSQL